MGVLSANAMSKVLAEICNLAKRGCKSVCVPIALAEMSTPILCVVWYRVRRVEKLKIVKA